MIKHPYFNKLLSYLLAGLTFFSANQAFAAGNYPGDMFNKLLKDTYVASCRTEFPPYGPAKIRLRDTYDASRKAVADFYFQTRKLAQELDILIQAGKIDVNKPIHTGDGDRAYPIQMAVAIGNLPMVEVLIKHGADVNKFFLNKYRTGWKPALPLAVGQGNIPMVELLIQHGANVNRVYRTSALLEDYTSPVLVAAQSGNLPMMEVLIKHGADVKLSSKQNFPVVAAARSGNVQLMELLIKKGVDLSLTYKTTGVVGRDINHKDHSPILNEAVLSGNKEMVDLLLKHVPNTNGQSNGMTKIAAWDWNVEMLAHLKDKGLPFHSESLNLANLETARYLLDNGFDIKRSKGQALGLACRYQLCNNGRATRDMDWKNSISEDENRELIRLLLERGADATIHEPVICPSVGEVIYVSASDGDVDTMKLLLRYGANINARNAENKDTLLHVAASNNQPKVISFLLSNKKFKFLVNTTNTKGETPLMHAARNVSPKAVRRLLSAGADPTIRDHKGKTAMMHFAKTIRQGKFTSDGKFEFDLGRTRKKKDVYEIKALLTKFASSATLHQ